MSSVLVVEALALIPLFFNIRSEEILVSIRLLSTVDFKSAGILHLLLGHEVAVSVVGSGLSWRLETDNGAVFGLGDAGIRLL